MADLTNNKTNTQAARLYSLGYGESRTYTLAALFIAGNLVLPQLCHLVPQGGLTLLPIYFFTLIGAYKYGWRVGLLTALLSPLANSVLFGMPPVAALPAILTKSVLLAIVAAWAARRTGRVSIAILLAVVLGYQLLGSMAESLLASSWLAGLQDFRVGIPGMLLQVFGGYAVLRMMKK